MRDFRRPCPHESSSTKCSTTLPDHHPLTREGVIELLNYAKDTTEAQEWAKVTVRLTQAIPGMVCPAPLNGRVANKSTKLETLMAANPRAGATSEMVDAVMALIQ